MNFRDFYEAAEEAYEAVPAEIPLPPAVYTLARIFATHGASLFAVGGVVRDYLFSRHHGGNFAPKDVDLATEVPPDRVLEILGGADAKRAGVKTFPKGESFGVISAVVGGDEYEIATFREDGQYTDGRRPDSVSFSTPGRDARRRDLTYNALFYDIAGKEIRDYNLDPDGRGQGLADAVNKVARPVGSARDRFREDKLRIPRLVRFFSRFNSGAITDHLDADTLSAVREFKNLAGVSPERVAAEFASGLRSAASPANYLKNYTALGLLPVVLPGLKVADDFDRVGSVKNVRAVLAWLLRGNPPQVVRSRLNALKYANDVSDAVVFLIRLYHFDVAQVAALLRQRDMYKQLAPELAGPAGESMRRDIMDFARIAGRERELSRFLSYQPVAKSADFSHLSGKALGDAMKAAEAENYARLGETFVVSPSLPDEENPVVDAGEFRGAFPVYSAKEMPISSKAAKCSSGRTRRSGRRGG